jgi:hypothetical protein
VECYNCHKKGHRKSDCWAKGGGKEGQGPRSRNGKGKVTEAKAGGKETEKGSANIADSEDGVWMASVDDSGDEGMADTEFDDFMDTEDNFEDEDDDDDEIIDITDHLKRVLHIPTVPPPYDIHDDLSDMLDSTDSSSDDEQGVAMQVMSDSDNDKVEINPYWCKIIVDELQGLGNPTIVSETDTESMPDLESVSDSETSEDSVQFVYTPPPSRCSVYKGSVKDEVNGCMEKLNLLDEDLTMILVDDKGEEGYSTFNAAMLVNVEGDVEGTQTELYDSGASRHMSPYRDHFENYVAIAPKSITAADKRHFQAIGKGDLRIKIPNGHGTTTVLLKDVLHCPDMGLTLVSIGKITAAGYKVIFRGPSCKIFDHKDKVIGLIAVKNGLYRVDHNIFVNMAMTGHTREVLTLEDLHK